MKYIRNKETDGVLERLLRAEMGRTGGPGAPCSQFDPDFSAAYIERNLTPGEISRYELHLAACTNCRIQVASLARKGYDAALVEVEEAAPSFERLLRKTERGFSRISRYLLQPRWIAVATAALVVLVAVPVLIILITSKPEPRMLARSAVEVREAAPTERPEGTARGSDSAVGSPGADEAPRSVEPGSRTEGLSNDKSTASVGNPSPGAGQAATAALDVNGPAASTGARSSDAPLQKTDPDSGPIGADRLSQTMAQNQTQQTNQQPTNGRNFKATAAREAPQVQDRVQEKQLKDQPASPSQVSASEYSRQAGKPDDKEAAAKKAEPAGASEQISPKEAQTLPDDYNKSGVSVLKGATPSDGSRAKESRQAIRAKDSEPPRTDSNRDETERRIAKGPARDFAGAGRGNADSVRQPTNQPPAKGQKLERRVETKRFRMQAGFWTDRNFKPAKEIPEVTLVRDTEVYKSALEKQPGLRAFLAGFGADERVIVVYKNIVYKIVPPKE